jgi:hypothetical protein
MSGFEEVVVGGGPSAKPTFLERGKGAMVDLTGN